MTLTPTLDAAGRRRSPATLPGYHAGRSPRNKGVRYPADPPTVEEIASVMREVGTERHGARLRALIAVLWRGGLRIQEALSLSEQVLGAIGSNRDPPKVEWLEHTRLRASAHARGTIALLLCMGPVHRTNGRRSAVSPPHPP
jgi:integrase